MVVTEHERLEQTLQEQGASIWRRFATEDEQVAADAAREAGWTQIAAINPAVVLSPCGHIRISIGRAGCLRSLEHDRTVLPTAVALAPLREPAGWVELAAKPEAP